MILTRNNFVAVAPRGSLCLILWVLSVVGAGATDAPTISIEKNGASISLSPSGDRSAAYIIEASESPDFLHPRIIEQTAETIPGKADQPIQFYRARALQPETSDYLLRSGVLSSYYSDQVDRWILELKVMGLSEKVRYMASFREGQIKPGLLMRPLIGPTAQANRQPAFSDGGMQFDGAFSLSVPNFLHAASVAKLSIFAVFQAEPNSAGLLFGQTGDQGAIGPQLSVGMSPFLNVDTENLFWTVTDNGKTENEFGFRFARTFNLGNTTYPQITLAAVQRYGISIQSNIDRAYAPGAGPARVFINNGPWTIGGSNVGASFKGRLFFMAAFEEAISPSEYERLFLAYKKTLGTGIPFPNINLLIEGDSLSEESTGKEYSRFLARSEGWKGRVLKKNIARGGEGINLMLSAFNDQVLPVFPGENWLFLWAGRNDIHNSPDNIFNGLKEYWRKARLAGYKVAAFTLIPAKYEAQQLDISDTRKRVNAKIRQAQSEYDWLIDLDSLPELSDPTNLTYFNPDGVHLTAAAGRRIAEFIARKITIPEN